MVLAFEIGGRDAVVVHTDSLGRCGRRRLLDHKRDCELAIPRDNKGSRFLLSSSHVVSIRVRSCARRTEHLVPKDDQQDGS